MERSDENWKVPPPSVKLLTSEIHLWRIDLESANAAHTSDANPLSADEIARASRFYFEVDRRRFSVTRIALRRILGGYISVDPAEIRFVYTEHGKPDLSQSQNRQCVRFNVSHSGRFGIIAVSLSRRIGVDVEQYRAMEFLEIARRYFSEREYSDLKAVPAGELEHYFFSYWTRKEAVLKAMGVGIANSLNQISLAVDSPRLIDCPGDPNALRQWWIMDLHVYPGYAGAVACEGETAAVQQWDITLT